MSITDIEVPSPFFPIRFERSYRSGRPYFGPFGFAWDHCYNVYLRPLANGGVALWWGRLRESVFRPDGPDWIPDHPLTVRFEEVNADVYDVVHPGGLRWRFERPPGWSDMEQIPLIIIQDRHNNRMILRYDGENRLSSAQDEAGRGLIFSYGNCGLLELVTDHTHTRQVRYLHDREIEHLTRVVLPATSQFPGGVTTTYDYDSNADHPGMRHNILRVLDADDNTYLENTYAGPESGWSFNSIIGQIEGGFEYQFDYEQLQYVPADPVYTNVPATRTTVLTPDGALHVHTFNYRGDLIDHRYRLNSDGSYRVVARQFSYDAYGNVTEAIAPDGKQSVMQYDSTSPNPCARSNLQRVVLTAGVPGQGSRIIQRAWYDSDYQLPIRITDETGNETRYIYDFTLGNPSATGRLVRVELPRVTLPNGNPQQSVVHLEQNERGQVTAVVSAEGSRTDMQYITSAGQDDGMLARFTRDATGAAIVTEFAYDPVGHVSRATDPAGHVTTLRHNALGQLEEVTPPAVNGVVSSYRAWYGDDGSPVRVEHPRGDYGDSVIADAYIADTFERDVLGRLNVSRHATNTERPRTRRQRVDHEGRPTRVIDPTGAVSKFDYDERGALLKSALAPSTPYEVIEQRSYDVAGRLRHIVDAAGGKTSIDSDEWGRVRSVKRSGGATHKFTWGENDLLLETTVEGSPGPGQPSRPLRKETYTYDERGRLIATTLLSAPGDPTNGTELTTEYTYDKDDRLRTVKLPRGSTVKYDYDGLGRLTLVKQHNGTEHTTVYTQAGQIQRQSTTETEGGVIRTATVSFEHDDRGRVTAAETSSGRTEFSYDERSALIECRAPGGVTSSLTTNPFGQVTRTVLDPAGLSIQSDWVLDDRGQLSTLIDPTGAKTNWDHDPLGRVKKLTMPDGSVWRYEHKPGDGVVRQINPSGTTVTVTLNSDRQPTKIQFHAVGVEQAPTHDFAYDSLGHLVLATIPTSVVARKFDSLGRLIQEASQGREISVDYDDTNGTVDLTYPDGRCERTHHDAMGRPTAVVLRTPGPAVGGIAGDVLATVEYSGHPVTITHGNGVETTLEYDQPGRIVNVEHRRAGTLIDGYRVRYDERGRRALVQLTGNPVRNTLHKFDNSDRLTQASWGFPLPQQPDVATQADHIAAVTTASVAATAATSSETYVLDQSDSRTQRSRTANGGAPVVENYVLDTDHRTISAAGTPIAYHDDGVRAAFAREEYDIDALGRIVRVRDNITGAVLAEIVYDALSRPVGGSVDGIAVNRTLLARDWIQESRGGAVRQATPHPIWGLPLCITDDMDTFFVHPDEGLSTLCVTDAFGNTREHHRYGPFGDPMIRGGDGITPIAAQDAVTEPRWRGMPFTSQIGLYASKHRMYDPSLGVFLSRDPLLYTDSPSPWVFAAHNAVDFADPSGLGKTPIGPRSHEADSSISNEELNKRSNALDRLVDVANYENAVAISAIKADGLRQSPTFDINGFNAAVYAVLREHEAARIINAGLKSAAAEEVRRRQEELAVEQEMPGTLASVTPLVGSAMQSKVHFQHGNYVRGVLHGGLAASDVFLVKSIAIGLGKGLAKVVAMTAPVAVAHLAAEKELPVVTIRFAGKLLANPSDAVFLAENLKMAEQDMGYLIHAAEGRLGTDAAFREAAREYMKTAYPHLDLSVLEAMHPLDSVAAGAYLKGGQGTTYYFGSATVNKSFGARLIRGLERAGVPKGGKFRIQFENFPDLPHVAPPASLPDLPIRYR